MKAYERDDRVGVTRRRVTDALLDCSLLILLGAGMVVPGCQSAPRRSLVPDEPPVVTSAVPETAKMTETDTPTQAASPEPAKVEQPANIEQPADAEQPATVELIAAEPVQIPEAPDGPGRWLWVEKERGSAEGAWATGSFDRKRNKVSIHTSDVAQFAINVSRIPINWERLVILGIDGRNSELRRRDYALLHFARDEHGRWVVLEP